MGSSRDWFQADILFLCMYFFVHFWLWIGVVLEWTSLSILPDRYIGRINYAVGLSLLGMAAFVLGCNLAPRVRVGSNLGRFSLAQWTAAGYWLFYTGVILTLAYALYFGREAFSGSYAGSSVGSLASKSVYLLQGVFLKLGILVLLVAKSNRSHIIPKCRLALFVLSGVLTMFLVLGDRSEFIYTLGVAAFAYTRFYRPVSLSILVAGILTISLLMSAVLVARRDQDRSLSNIAEAVQQSDDEVSVSAGLDNVASSGGVMLASVVAVPMDHDYFYGELKRLELAGILPFARRVFYTDQWSDLYYNSSTFLTWYILGPHATSGTGTTIVADLYVDFGSVGVVFGLGFLGWLANWLRFKMGSTPNLMNCVLFCSFAGLLILLPRYSFLQIIRGLLWPMVAIWVIGKLRIRRASVVGDSQC